jgi:endonuclease-3
MKNGTAYAARLKKAYAKQKKAVGKIEPVDNDEPMRRLAIGILGIANGDEFAERLVNRLTSNVVSWNELRVSSPMEAQRAAGDTAVSHAPQYEALIRALQAVFDRENAMSLDRLKTMGLREARAFLESLDGVDAYAVASVVQWSLGGHAIPVCDRLLDALRQADLVHPEADRAEVQAFLERHVPAAEGRYFCAVMRNFAAPQRAGKKSARSSASKKRGSTKRKSGSGSAKSRRGKKAVG